ncbi:MAG: type II secretion system secretin GspD [Gammaproteobacteria bacterium]|nr:type II secretion system secretin GspD [Gammaproteobacteria bacterium]MBT8111011.1 type II secretion system secretin GspD [Gammaproteobacteria bacterium]NND48447.1 type II secretion system secretin GspD [Woeseiaceae bacterium]NNL45709.1 type II secretion system secretin GspD [Woeseiaceae bacterium]
MKRKTTTLNRGSVRLLLTTLLLSVASVAWTQQADVTLNWNDADIRKVVEAVSEVTGKNFILDPRVTGKVTLLSSSPMSPDAFYEAFLSILQVHGYVAIQSGDLIKIIPDATARQFAGPIGTTGLAGPDDLATQVIQVHNVGATQLVPILRPLIPQYGHMVAHAGSNMLIISDRAANVARMVSIIRRIDQASDEDIEVVTLQHASAAEIVRIMTALSQTPRSDGAPVTTSLVADARTNSVLIGGDKSDRLRLRTLIAHLDTPLEDGGDTQVRYLRYADAEELAAKLQQHFTTQAGGSPAAAAAASADKISVWADTQTNAIVVNAPPKMMRSLTQIVDKLDIRRAQVLVEAIIVEVIADDRNELGTSWAVEGSGSDSPIAVTNFPDFLSGVVQLGSAAGSGVVTDPSGLIGDGITIGVGRISDSGVSFAAILKAAQGDADTNIISTPSIVTTDNEEASLNVGQEVPFVTGSFTNTGGTAGSVNPFQTINREQIGVKLTITPQINEGDSMVLKISQEISSIAQSAGGAVDLITNQRIVETTVIVDDGEILVLGGLIEDQLRESDQRVPILGRVPLLGNLFRARKTEKIKTNLMIFIRPKILRDARQTAFETNQKYNMIRDVQQGQQGNDIQLMPGEQRPMLPPIDEYSSQDPAGAAEQ